VVTRLSLLVNYISEKMFDSKVFFNCVLDIDTQLHIQFGRSLLNKLRVVQIVIRFSAFTRALG